MSGQPFSHPNFGNEVRLEQTGREVKLIFVAKSEAQAESLADTILSQLKSGAINLTMMGKPTSISEETR
jgi:hypothetical protein